MIVFLALALSLGVSARSAQITIYSGDKALLKERRVFDLKKGFNETSAYRVPSGFDPGSVQIRVLSGENDVQILGEDFDPGFSNESDILKESIGREVSVEQSGSPSSLPRILKGILLEAGGDLRVIESGNKIYLNPKGTFILPAPKTRSVFEPSLKWAVKASKSGRYQFETSYLTGGFSWSADYSAVLNSSSDLMDLNVWASLKNSSGVDFPGARVRLVAGSPNRSFATPSRPRPIFRALAASTAQSPLSSGKSFFEYHLYVIPRPIDLDHGSRRISFGRASDVPVRKIYLYDASDISGDFTDYTRSNPNYGAKTQGQVKVVFKLKNSKTSHLGFPLPPGRVRLYQKDRDGSLEWVGEDALPPTAKDEKIAINAGRAFDIIGERIQTDFSPEKNGARESFSILLKNHKNSGVVVTVVEHLYRWSRWKITASTAKWVKKDAQTIEFDVPVKKNSKSEINYSVKYSW